MDPATLRDDMVDGLEHETKGVLTDDRVGLAMRAVPRERFVPDPSLAYEDRSHEFEGTTVLAPSLAGRLLEALAPRPGDSVLIVGTGVGYTAALAAEIVGPTNVHGIDIDPSVVLAARGNLRTAGYREALVDRGDGARGLADYAPFDRILVEAAAVRPPEALIRQLSGNGRLVLPLADGPQQLVAMNGDEILERFGRVRFKPLLHRAECPTSGVRNRMEREDFEFARRHFQSRSGWEQSWIDWDRTPYRW